MDFLVNDRSLQGQFHDNGSFQTALNVIMSIRAVIQRFGCALHCHRNLLDAQLGPNLNLQRAVQALPKSQQRALMQWLTRHGPFWEDLRIHGPDDYLEWRDEIVTDTAIGEAAFAMLNGIERHLVSFTQSDFCFTPIIVDLISGSGRSSTQVANYWEPKPLEDLLHKTPPPILSWAALEAVSRARFHSVTICDGAFDPLVGHPFALSAAERLIIVLQTLDRFCRCFDADGNRTAEGNEIYQNFFTGKKGDGGRGALFSDSSDTEKKEFAAEMTFPHPEKAGDSLICTWHGKVQTPQLRVHFSYPVRADQPLYVVYVGPKITKR